MIQEINHLICIGNLQEALKLTDSAIQKNGDFYLYHDKRVEILIALGDRLEAARSLKEAIRLSPELPFLRQRLTSLTLNHTAGGIFPTSVEETLRHDTRPTDLKKWPTNHIKPTTIVFFGASVTQQGINREGVKVGYVPNVIDRLGQSLDSRSFEFHQMGYGSNHFSDAGYILFNEVLSLDPDIVVFEWFTTSLDTFDSAKLDFVIRTLIDRGTEVVSLVLPFKRVIGKPERPCIQQVRWYQRLGLHQINLNHEVGRAIDLDICLRDEVQTSEQGGVAYANLIGPVLQSLVEGKLPPHDPGSEIVPMTDRTTAPIVSTSNLEGLTLKPGDTLKVSFENGSCIQLYGYSTLGPYSPVLDVRCGDAHHSMTLFDKWCTYERTCLKAFSKDFNVTANTLEIRISDADPEPQENGATTPGETLATERYVKNIKSLHMVGANIVSTSIEVNKPEKIKVLIFANCHGAIYLQNLKAADPESTMEFEHIISYENLSNFEQHKSKFEKCDILIIQPIQNYDEFKIERLRPILKPSCEIILVPFFRFNGFWDLNNERDLTRFSKAAVMFFPNIQDNSQVDAYLKGRGMNPKDIESNFERSIAELRIQESLGDVEIVDFFLKNYKSIPLFRDPYHPTGMIYQHLSYQIILRVLKQNPAIRVKPFHIQEGWIKEYGHFKPISNLVASTLGLKYDLDSYFVYRRADYLNRITAYENNPSSLKINNLNELKVIFSE